MFSIFSNTQWSTADNHASTNGTFVTCGNYSGLVLAANSISNCCNKCYRGIKYPPTVCALNAEMHAKTIESFDAKNIGRQTFLTFLLHL